MWLASASEVPAGAYRLTVKPPSLNGGKNSVPKRVTITAAAMTKAAAMAITAFAAV